MPNTILILGGSGKVGKLLTKRLVASTSPAYAVHSVIRSSKHTDALTALGATPHIHSVEETDLGALSSLFRSIRPSAIVWAAGAGGGDPSRTQKVDRDGAILAMDAAAEAGVARFVMVSAVDVRDREGKAAPAWYTKDDKERSDRVWGAIGPYMKCKFEADKELRVGNGRRGLKYTIVRPSSLTEDEGTGKVAAGQVSLVNPISRDDVAAVIVECLKNDGTAGLAFDVTGGDTPVSDAVKKVVDEKIDCFEGYY